MTNKNPILPAEAGGLTLRPAFAVSLKLGRPVLGGLADGGPARAVISIDGGEVAGPRLSGVVRAGGSEWARLGPGPRVAFDARYVVATPEGVSIFVENSGYRWSSPDVEARLRSGEAVSPDAYYMVAAPRFDVAAGPYDWLTRTVIVGRGERLAGGNRITFYTVENA